MTLTTTIEIDEITISSNGAISIRQNTSILDGEIVIGNTFHRSTITPGQDISNQPANVVAICNVTWTPDVITSYQASLPQTIPIGV